MSAALLAYYGQVAAIVPAAGTEFGILEPSVSRHLSPVERIISVGYPGCLPDLKKPTALIFGQIGLITFAKQATARC